MFLEDLRTHICPFLFRAQGHTESSHHRSYGKNQLLLGLSQRAAPIPLLGNSSKGGWGTYDDCLQPASDLT